MTSSVGVQVGAQNPDNILRGTFCGSALSLRVHTSGFDLCSEHSYACLSWKQHNARCTCKWLLLHCNGNWGDSGNGRKNKNEPRIGEERELPFAFPSVADAVDRMPLRTRVAVMNRVLLLGSNSWCHALLLVVTTEVGYAVSASS